MKVEQVTNEEMLKKALKVREIVFINEQNVSVKEEVDEFDHLTRAVHFLVTDQDQPIGAGRLRVMDMIGKVQRICVLKEVRGKGIGQLLMEKVEDYALSKGLTKLKLDAQVQAIAFYQRLGYQVCSEEFLDAGIVHRTMEKRLSQFKEINEGSK